MGCCVSADATKDGAALPQATSQELDRHVKLTVASSQRFQDALPLIVRIRRKQHPDMSSEAFIRLVLGDTLTFGSLPGAHKKASIRSETINMSKLMERLTREVRFEENCTKDKFDLYRTWCADHGETNIIRSVMMKYDLEVHRVVFNAVERFDSGSGGKDSAPTTPQSTTTTTTEHKAFKEVNKVKQDDVSSVPVHPAAVTVEVLLDGDQEDNGVASEVTTVGEPEEGASSEVREGKAVNTVVPPVQLEKLQSSSTPDVCYGPVDDDQEDSALSEHGSQHPSTPGAHSAAPSTAIAPAKPVQLPPGDWEQCKKNPQMYYSKLEHLFFHPDSGWSYDPDSEMWYNPDDDQWVEDCPEGAS